MEVVIIPWRHELSKEHDNAMEILKSLPKGTPLAMEMTTANYKLCNCRETRASFAENSPLGDWLMYCAGVEVSDIISNNTLTLFCIDSPELWAKQGEWGKKTRIDWVRADMERDAFFAEEIEKILEDNSKVYVLVGFSHVGALAEKLKKNVKEVTILQTVEKNTQEYMDYVNAIKTKLASGKTPSEEELVGYGGVVEKIDPQYIKKAKEMREDCRKILKA